MVQVLRRGVTRDEFLRQLSARGIAEGEPTPGEGLPLPRGPQLPQPDAAPAPPVAPPAAPPNTWDFPITPNPYGGAGVPYGGAGVGSSRGEGGLGTRGFQPQPFGSVSASAGLPASTRAFQSMIEQALTRAATGGDVPFSPETIARLSAGAGQRASASARQGIESARADALSRGVYRSSAAVNDQAAAQAAARAQQSGEINAIESGAAQANYTARVGALAQARQMLDSTRQYLLSADLNAFKRDELTANLTLAYANLDQQERDLRARLGFSYDELGSRERIVQSEQQAALERLLAQAGLTL